MKPITYTLSIVIAVLFSNCLNAQSSKFMEHEKLSQEAEKIIQTYVDMNWFSGVVAIVKDGKAFFQKAYGYADIDQEIPNTLNTKFRIGSINKTYTDVLVNQMLEQKKLSYDDRLEKFDLGFPEEIASKITIRHLLTHTSGFGDIFIPEYLDNIRDYKDIDDILPLLMHKPLIYETGEDERYSNYGYIVLGAILEKISGEKFGTLLQRNIFDVLGVKNTHYNIAEQIEGEAQSYRFSLKGEKIDFTSQLEYCTPDGGMYATVDDLVNFFQSLLYSEKLLTNEQKAIRAYGYRPAEKSWEEILEMAGGMGDAGGGPGVSTLVEMNLKENYMVVVLANTDQQIAEEVGLRIFASLHKRKYEEAKLPPAFYAYQLSLQNDEATLVANYKKLMKAAGYKKVHAGQLNHAGYLLMNFEQDIDEAIKVFRLNTLIYPKEANVWDSLGEAYAQKGEREKAILAYEKALAIDPDFGPSQEKLKALK